MTSQDYPLTLFYDGTCPLCMMEMKQLMKRNSAKQLAFEDINVDDFSSRYPTFDKAALNARIHAMWSNGDVITGLDVTYEAWRAVGKGWVYAPLRWPLIKPLADWGYTKFAKHRYTISFLLTGKRRQCDSGVCR